MTGSFTQSSASAIREIALRYLDAKEAVIRAGFAGEIDWQHERDFSTVDAGEFVRQGAWVIVSSGLSSHAVNALYPGLARAFFSWDISRIREQRPICRRSALGVLRHEAKIDAILALVDAVHDQGFDAIRTGCLAQGAAYLTRYPYLGEATSRHLAKNLGFDVAKPDRHLMRLSELTGFASPQALCETLAYLLAEPVGVVDLVLWRFATLNRSYLSHFDVGAR